MATSIGSIRNTKVFKQENATFEQEQDANSALSDLDRALRLYGASYLSTHVLATAVVWRCSGLRSMKVGVQCEAVVKFPRLFEKYPFPILINSAFLRLADVFRAGNNFIRWCILRVALQSEKHLDKILNVDEFMRRIFTVYHSNDPIARAITLRTLGSISIIVGERKNLHHSVVISLDSNDAVEVAGAVYAAQRFSSQSRVFAANVCDRISEKINSIATPIDLKLSLIPVLQYMHHDVTLAAKARHTCLVLLTQYPTEKFMMLTLRTMSHLAALSLIDIPAQIELLLTTLENDIRRNIQVICLQDLKRLAVKGPHLWTFNHVLVLCEFVQSAPYIGLKKGTLDVLTMLSRAVTFKMFFTKQDFHSSLLDMSNFSYQHEDPVLVSKAIEFFSNIVIAYTIAKNTEYWCGQNLVDSAVMAIQTQILVLMSDENQKQSLKQCLRCAVDIVKQQPRVAEQFVTCISNMLADFIEPNGAELCECLAAVGSLNPSLVPKTVLPQLLSVLQASNQSSGEPSQFSEMISLCSMQASAWVAYKIARQAMRYGQCSVAEKLFSNLTQKVSSEHYFFWLTGLRDISHGEKCLQGSGGNTVPKITDSLTYYHKGITSLKAALIPSFPLQFQCEYVQLRAVLLEAHAQLILTCNTFRTCPPPAIATALADANGMELTKYEHIVSQLTKTSTMYEKASERFAALYQQSFDADPISLQNILLLQLCCELMKLAIISIAQSRQELQTLLADKMMLGVGEVTDADGFKQLLFTIHSELGTLLKTEGTHLISYKHIDFLSSSADRLATAPNCFPRYFFQGLQQTALKLAISPQQSGAEPVLVQNDTHLTLKVEGVIMNGNKPGLFRQIHSIRIQVTSSLLTKQQTSSDQKITESTTNSLEQSTEPHNDYFSVSVLLRFPVNGIHTVTIEAAIIDTDGALWKTGPTASLQVKSYDDILQKHQQGKHSQRPSYSQIPS